MKKFLTFLIVLVVVFTFGLVIYRLVRNEESITIASTSAYYNVGEEVSFEYKVKNANRSSKVEVKSSDDNVVKKVEEGGKIKFYAVGGGYCQIVIEHTNPKGSITRFAKDVAVGDGLTIETPWYIRNENEFLNIFTNEPEGKSVEDKLKMHYCQTADITLSNAFTPTNATLVGSYRGILLDDASSVTRTSYSKIIGYKVDATEANQETSSLFKDIATSGKFGYINFVDVNINGSFTNASVVCAENHGTIDFVTVAGTINNTNTESKTAGIATANTYASKSATAPTITRCTNYATITTSGNQIAGIVYENNANVSFCINGGEKETEGKLSASGTNLIAGGIVGVNSYGFGDALQNAIDTATPDNEDKVATELAYRPQVKDCYSTSVIVASPSLNGTTFVGGVIGQEINGSSKSVDNIYNQTFDNLTLGNYYIKEVGEDEEASDENIVVRGIGNREFTKVTNVYSPATKFVAVGITVDQLMEGILTLKDEATGETARASLVSFYDQKRNTTRVTWLDEGMYYFYTLNGSPKLPILNKTTSYWGNVNYRLPSTNVALSSIDSLTTFLQFDFSDTTTANGIKEYIITGWIDFEGSLNADRFKNYYTNKGTEDNPAQFVIRAEQAKDDKGNLLYHDEAKTIPMYYGFKNLGSLEGASAKYEGLFGYIKNSTFEDVSFVNCYYQASDTAIAAGVLAGYAENSNFSNVRFFTEGEGSPNGVYGGAQIENMGAVAGQLKNSNVSNIYGTLLINGSSKEDANVGGIIGLAEDTNVRNVTSEVAIGTSSANAGGVVGRMNGGAASRIKLSTAENATIEAKSVGGFAYALNNAQVDTVVLNTSLDGIDNTAGVAVDARNNTTFNNASLNTEFKGGSYQAGLFVTLANTASAQNVVHTNNFNNEAGTRYAKTQNITAQRHSGDGISDNQVNVESGAGTLNNCFVLNKVLGVRNYNASETTFYAAQCSWIDSSTNYVQNSSYDPTSKTVYATWWGPFGQWVTIYGNYGAGILNEQGALYKSDSSNYSLSLRDGFGFGSEWNFDGFPTLNF